jgi:DNA processing protein
VSAGAVLPPDAHLVALAGLPGITPRRLGALVAASPPPEAWAGLVARPARLAPTVRAALGAEAPTVLEAWAAYARTVVLDELWQRHRQAGVGVLARWSAAYPAEAFEGERWPPEVLFHRGDPDRLAGARVAVVGTRACTRAGRQVAWSLGDGLAAAGVAVVSGLALGIDAATHEGALRRGGAPPVGVVGSGLDVVYPARNDRLWASVADAGVLLSEHPLGTAPVARHFPQRNRLIAALADVVVVVESHGTGGALGTAAAARRLGRTVLAVPGAVHAGASSGTNDLLADGAGVCRGVEDVLIALGMTAGARRSAAERRPAPRGPAAVVLDALGWTPATLDGLVARCGLDLGVVALAVESLAGDGWVVERNGWFERLARGAGPPGPSG